MRWSHRSGQQLILSFHLARKPGLERPALAIDKVRFVGEAVAVVVETNSAAADGTELVIVDYEPLGAVTSIEEATGSIVHGMRSQVQIQSQKFPQKMITKLSLMPHRTQKQSNSSIIVALQLLSNKRMSSRPRSRRFTVWASFSSPAPFTKPNQCGLTSRKINVAHHSRVGGGFGQKINFTPELLHQLFQNPQ